MDRLFVLQESYVRDLHNTDGFLYENAMIQFCGRNLDKYCLSGSPETPDERIEKAVKAGMKIIPVGTLEFVHDAMRKYCGIDMPMKPIEVPEELIPFAGRRYEYMLGKDIPEHIVDTGAEFFLKDAEHLKAWNNLLIDGSSRGYINPETRYVVSERKKFLSEYRAFVFRGEIQEVCHYLGDPMVFPDADTLTRIIGAYKARCRHPKSYCIDVFVAKKGLGTETGVIEIHPFVSCGLYGFFDANILSMLEDGLDWYIQEAGEQ